jgi:hypothetical protein
MARPEEVLDRPGHARLLVSNTIDLGQILSLNHVIVSRNNQPEQDGRQQERRQQCTGYYSSLARGKM